ncbi:protein SMALL AUXIN UP-REGULATED RNA 9 [Spinacia oleracea]|uniref:Protein SMALL AUXIN UP-REGULATED RNA 9 n=1 Tax=Spinacia oleracea TaxID=3562 RepID=A0ABM3R4C2_SPIOL|nr:protein SMALL AUXIN UP-REGULATED RNA 9 [Spinacia oleracea]
MDSSKQSNKISDIVRLKQMLKKWRKQAHEAKAANNSNSNNNNNNNSSSSINFLKRTLSFTDLSANNGVPSNNAVPKGFLAVQVGEEMKRFVIPTKYLSHQAFSVLLKEAEEEFGYQKEGVLKIPCEVEVFENILKMVEEKNSSNAKQSLKFSRNDVIVCGSSESQSLSQSHHPPSPMCR